MMKKEHMTDCILVLMNPKLQSMQIGVYCYTVTRSLVLQSTNIYFGKILDLNLWQ